MRVLGIGLRLVVNRLLGHVVGPELLPDVLAHVGQRLVGDAGRVGSHVGDETHGAFTRQLDALVELLRDHHRLLDREARRLLQLAGDERRNRALLAFLGRDRRDGPVRLLQVLEDGVRFGFVPDLDVRAVLLEELGVELRRHRPGQPRGQVPILLGDERADLAFAIDDDLEGDRLHPAGAQAATDLVPEDRTDLVADQPVEDPARLLRVDHLLVDLRRLVECREHTLLGDLVEHQAANLLAIPGAQFLGEMPANGLPFAVRVGCDEDLCGFLGGRLQLRHHLLAARDDFVRRLEPFFDRHPELALGQIADVPHRGDDLVVLAEIFVDGLRLCRRLHHDE